MGISLWQLLIVLVIVLLLFGTKKLRNMGGDLGSAIKSFRSAVKDGGDEVDKAEADTEKLEQDNTANVVEGEVAEKERDRAQG